jgi:nicotinate-nucleotide adenylyltransferase
MHVGIFGGSFNPPHLAHLVVAESVRDQFRLDEVLWIPNGRPPHKTLDQELVAPAHRLAMTRLATSDNPAFRVSDIEMRDAGTGYTVDTLRLLEASYPETHFELILGGDSLADFSGWHRPGEILDRVPLIVYHRRGFDGIAEAMPSVARIRFVDAPLLDVSGTRVRERLRQGRSVRYLVPESVRAYIEAEHLYR